MARSAQTASRPTLKIQEFTPGVVKDAMKNVSATAGTVYMVPIDSIEVEPGFNLRVTNTEEYQDGIAELKESIKNEGFYRTKPLAGYVTKNGETGENHIIVTDGHRRLEAAKMANAEGADIEKLPMIFRPATISATDLTVALHRENTGVPLTMLERAVLAKRLLNSGMTEEEVASKMSFTTRYISDLMVLVSAPKSIRNMVAEGKISGTEAVKQLRKNADEAVDKLTILAAKADAKGQKRVTAADTSGARGEEGVAMRTYKREIGLKAGEVADLSEYGPVASLFGFDDLFKPTGREGRIKALVDFTVVARIRRPKVEKPEEEQPAAEEPRKRGRKAKQEEAEGPPPGREVDPMTMGEGGEDDDTPAPDLRELGITGEPVRQDPADGL